MDSKSVAQRIRAMYASFSPSERSVADILLGDPHLMSGFTATELANEAEVSKATVTRFIDKLGFPAFSDFRRTVRDTRSSIVGSPLELLEQGLAATDGDLQRLIAETLRSDQANLSQTYENLDIEEARQIIGLLSEARQLIFADFRKQYALAYYATTLFQTIRPDVFLLPTPGASPADNTLDLGSSDVVVMFPFRRPMQDQDMLSQAVLDSGAKLIAIGDIWPTPPTQKAHIHIRCSTESPGVFDSFVAPMSLINMLFTATANILGSSARDRLTQLEHRHHTFQTFMTGYNTVVRRRDTDVKNSVEE